MICKKLDELELAYIDARTEARISGEFWTDKEFRSLEAIFEHKREGHDGGRCLGD